MASDPLRPSDSASASASDFPSTSGGDCGGGDRKVKLRYSYGGKILPRLSDGALRYVGGETRILTVRRDATLAEIVCRLADAFGGPVVLRYQLPFEDLDALISVSTDEDLENMMDEYDKLAAENPNAKLRLFLFSPSEVAGPGADPLSAYQEFQDTGARYLEAVNGLDSSIRGRGSATSFSSTQNSDGIAATEAVINGDVPDPPKTTNSSERTQFVNSSQSELPPVMPNQNKTLNSNQVELPSGPPFVPQSYIDPEHAQMMNTQPFVVMGLPPQINIVAVPPHGYMASNQTNIPTPQVGNGVARVDPPVDHNAGKIAKIPSDAKLQPLSQLPPLPPPHLLAPNVERRQVTSLAQGMTMSLDDCILCQRALPHAHSDTLINEQGNGLRHAIPDGNMVMQSHHSEDLSKIRAPHTTDVVLPVDNEVEIQAKNLVVIAPPRTYEFTDTIYEMPQINGRPVVHSSIPEHANVVVPPASAGSTGIPQASVITNPQKPYKENSVHKQQELLSNIDYSNVLLTPASLGMPHNLYGTFVIPSHSHGEDYLQQQMPLPQQIGLPNYPVTPDFMSNQFISDASLAGNSDFRGNGLAIHGTVPAFMYARPADGTIESLCMNPAGIPGFSDQPRPVVLADIGTSRDLKREKPPLVMMSANNTGPQDRVNGLPISNPLIGSVVVPEGNTGLLVDQLPSVPRDVAYLQTNQLPNTSHTPSITANTPYSYHIEAGVGARAIFNNIDAVCNNNVISINPIGERKDEAPNVHPVEVFNDVNIPQNNSAQLHSNLDRLHQALSSDPLVSNKDPQKTIENTILPPRPNIISSKDTTATKDLHSRNYPVNAIVSERTIPAGGVSSHIPETTLSMDAPAELLNSLKVGKGLEDAHIEQDVQTVEGSTSVSVLQSSEVPVPVLNSHETKETSPSSEKECCTVEIKTEIEDQTENKNKLLEKVKNNFPTTDDIGHLQIIKNSDLEELQELGSGTFGTVYHGKWRGTDVAIKRINERVFSGKSSEQERARADFWNEACKLASLHHPNVVAFYGIVLDGPGGSIATVTEFMVNGSLRRALQKNDKSLDKRRCLLIAMDVAFGMEYLHSKNIIHFDLKSDNLLVNLRDPQRPICKVGDLGLSKVKYETLMSGGMRGTLPWMAPELLGGKDNKYTEKVDVFSFGIVMWELITGEEPYGDMHYGAIIGGILNDTLRPPVPESCDTEWRSLMEQCWATEPSQRPSFTEIASRLRAIAASLPQKG